MLDLACGFHMQASDWVVLFAGTNGLAALRAFVTAAEWSTAVHFVGGFCLLVQRALR